MTFGNVIFPLCLVGLLCSVNTQKVNNPKFVRSPPVSCADKIAIVDAHNNVRRALASGSLIGQPQAMNMQAVGWDVNLENLATAKMRCSIFSTNCTEKDDRFTTSANVFMLGTSNPKNTAVDWNRPLTVWANEGNSYQFQPTSNNPKTIHYTQMIWAQATYIGCATMHVSDSKNWLYKFYTCLYGPAGNWYGDYPYLDGSVDDFQTLLNSGVLTDPDLRPSDCSNLCCSSNQCNQPYGPNCTH